MPTPIFNNPSLDYLTIVSGHAFKRLGGKTQVLTGKRNIHIRDRLTHSLEVSAVAKMIYQTLPKNLKSVIDVGVIENVSILHDIGHPPYGHFGTDIFNEAFSEHGITFEDNANSLIVIEKEFQNISDITKVSIIKYPFLYDLSRKKGLYPYQFKKYIPILKKCIELQTLNKEIEREITYECEIMEMADDISYLTGDVEDVVYYFDVLVDDILLNEIFDTHSIKNDFVYNFLLGVIKNNVREKMQELRIIMINNILFDISTNSFVFKNRELTDFYNVLRQICLSKFIKFHSIRHNKQFANIFPKYVRWLISKIDDSDIMKKHMVSRTYFKKYSDATKKSARLKALLSSLAESTDDWIYKNIKEFQKEQEEALWIF